METRNQKSEEKKLKNRENRHLKTVACHIAIFSTFRSDVVKYKMFMHILNFSLFDKNKRGKIELASSKGLCV